MEDNDITRIIKNEFAAKNLRLIDRAFGGCISDGTGYDLDEGRLQLFVKRNNDEKAKVMFDGEYTGLKKISETNTIRVPQPKKVLPLPDSNGWVFVMEYIKMTSLNKYMRQLGVDLARLHLHNLSLESRDTSSVHSKNSYNFECRFGFECATCCGFIPMCNEWESDWTFFYARYRLKPQIDTILQKYGDRQVMDYWLQLERKLPSLFEGIVIKPSLLHGDLWAGNASETTDGPVVFDPAAFYGHSEFDLAITRMFGGFNAEFYDGYHNLVPKSPGFDNRQNLYLLFHYLNHWNHFGSSYRQQSLQLMKQLIH